MTPRSNSWLASALTGLLATAPAGEAMAGNLLPPGKFGTMAKGPSCGGAIQPSPAISKNITVFKPVTINNKVNIYKPITINKPVTINKIVTVNKFIDNSKSIAINKPVTIQKTIDNSKHINVYKPVTINNNVQVTKNIDNSKKIEVNKSIDLSKNINLSKSVVINKNIDNSKNINIQKNVTINKQIVINKGGDSTSAFAFANAFAAAHANAAANAQAIVYGGSQYVTIANRTNVGGEISVHAEAACVEQEANVVKSIHAVCVDRQGREYPASHMIPETWIDASYEGEIARCIAGATVRVQVGDVSQSDHGLAGTYEHGETLSCAPGEALVHYRGGMLKCAKARPVKDCTERDNLRRWGAGDFFFSYRARVCVIPSAQATATGEDLSGMTLEGGVGSEDSGY